MRKPLGSEYSFGCGGPLARTCVMIGAVVPPGVVADVAAEEPAVEPAEEGELALEGVGAGCVTGVESEAGGAFAGALG